MDTLSLIPEKLTNENRLLLACAREVWTARQLEEARASISGGVDWTLLRGRAREHGLSPLLYWHLQQNFSSAVPSLAEQRQEFFANGVRNLSLTASLLDVLDALNAAGLSALAYKGPALAASLYGDINLRQMWDLDVLVDASSFPAARKVLGGLGYHPVFAHSRKQEAARMRSDCECEFFNSERNVMLDLHWQITAPHLAQRFCFENLWNRRRTVAIGQKPVSTLSAEDTTLVLAVHGGKHMWKRLSWLADFAESLRQDLNWHTLKSRASEAGAERMLWLALALAEGLLQAELPPEFVDAVRNDGKVRSIASEIARTLFESENGAEESEVRWLTLLRLADSRWSGVSSAARFAFGSGPREWEAIRLPDSLFAFYRLVRIATLVRRAPSFLIGGGRIRRG